MSAIDEPLLPHPSTTTHDGSYVAYLQRTLGIEKMSPVRLTAVGFAGVGAIVCGIWAAIEFGGNNKQPNVIMLISDGFGPASQTLARNFNGFVTSQGPEALLPLDHILVGSSRTRSSSSFVTDSAAGATAFSCAIKSYNGAIGVNSNAVPCGTVLEAAKLRGYMTGLVATSRITHATPASFSAHVIDRDMEDEIAVQQIGNYSLGRMVDVAFGGGSCHFKPQTGNNPDSCRQDNSDLFAWGIENVGWNLVDNVDVFRQLDSKNPQLPIMGLFTPDHMSYEIDRDPTKEPSLKEMAIKALNILSGSTRKSRKGFFIMIEGSRIDMAGHSNDAAAHVHEILAYNEMIESVVEWVNKHPNTVMISTSDHETGGLSVAHQLGTAYPDYAWYPSALVAVKNSTEKLGQYLFNFPDKAVFTDLITQTVIPKWLGIHDASLYETDFMAAVDKTASQYSDFAAKMVSDRAGLGWATHGHSAVDVNLYAHGYRSQELRGNHENTDIGKFMTSLMKVDLDKVTALLVDAVDWWDRVVGGYDAWTVRKGIKSDSKGYVKVHYHQKP
ncbi:hypothetical protein HDU98_004258 [Podochytrium sp. JEL0797]|nr:hypothetical protein HDU98_004258 [Podochytrium sp. JEL0797]